MAGKGKSKGGGPIKPSGYEQKAGKGKRSGASNPGYDGGKVVGKK